MPTLSDYNLTFSAGFGCPKSNFLCRNKMCILPSFKCDGKDDCGDNTDENECNGIIIWFIYFYKPKL